MKINKVLVTGSRGFIGKHLCKSLRENGIRVVTHGKERNKLDVTNLGKILTIEDVEAVVHLAAKTSILDSMKNPYQTYFTNIVGTLNLLEFARIRNVRKFIYVSTYVYGQPQYLPIDEKHVVNPHSPYNRSKLLAEELCQNYSHDFGIDIVILRPFYVYGPDSRDRSFIPSIIQQIKKNAIVELSGEQIKRDFLFVTDFVLLLQIILREFPNGYNIYNAGYGTSYSLKEVAQSLAKLLDRKIAIQSFKTNVDDISDMRADITKVSKTFKWKPTVDIGKGLRLIVQESSN
ncbi:MAG TPA: NAD-dependent epimerase/dehydratase family protein [Nitrososphaeraceae archaeon]